VERPAQFEREKNPKNKGLGNTYCTGCSKKKKERYGGATGCRTHVHGKHGSKEYSKEDESGVVSGKITSDTKVGKGTTKTTQAGEGKNPCSLPRLGKSGKGLTSVTLIPSVYGHKQGFGRNDIVSSGNKKSPRRKRREASVR